MNFEDYGDVHVAAAVLKTFLRELPQPLLTSEAYEQVLGITGTCPPRGARQGPGEELPHLDPQPQPGTASMGAGWSGAAGLSSRVATGEPRVVPGSQEVLRALACDSPRAGPALAWEGSLKGPRCELEVGLLRDPLRGHHS